MKVFKVCFDFKGDWGGIPMDVYVIARSIEEAIETIKEQHMEAVREAIVIKWFKECYPLWAKHEIIDKLS